MDRLKASKSIRGKLLSSYGLLIIFFILLSFGFNLFLTYQLKTRGIDSLIEHSMSSVFTDIESRLSESVKQYLLIENEKIITRAELYSEFVDRGHIPEQRAKDILLDSISRQKIGNSGYTYVVGFDGIMFQHPVDEYMGTDFSLNPTFQIQASMENGYIEYEYENPGDEEERGKILYMSRYEPWEWIISTTAYVDDPSIRSIRLEDIQPFLQNQNSDILGCISIYDKDGEYLISAKQDSFTDCNLTEILKQRLSGMKEMDSGVFDISVKTPEDKSRRVTVFYKYIPKLDWMIVVSSIKRELYAPVINAYIMLSVIVIVSLVLLNLLNRALAFRLTEPLMQLVDIFDSTSSGDLSRRVNIETGDEFESLGRYFNRFMDEIDSAQNSIKMLAKFSDENTSPIIRVSTQGRIEYANRVAVSEILSPNKLVINGLIPAGLLKELTKQKALSGRNEYSIGEKTFSFAATYISEEDGSYLYGRDITRQKKFESIQLLSDNIFQNSIEGIVITDAEGVIESVNPAFTQITEYSAEEAVGENPRILKSHRHDSKFYESMWHQLKEKGYWDGEIWNKKKSGSVYPEFLTITSMRDEDGKINRFISFFHDLSAVKEKEEKIIFEATHDQLTGLPNRNFLNLSLTDIIENTGGNLISFTAVYMDINNLKRINESIGPDSGDRLLIDFSERIQEIVTEPDLLVRVGSDEFVCIFNNCNKNEVIDRIENISKKFIQPFIIKEREIYIDVSFGIASFPDDSKEPLELLSKSEAAMLASKKDVNRIYSFYSPALQNQGLSRLEIETGMKAAFENGKFYLNYQPKISVETGRITGAEALVRVEDIEGQFVGPDIFIPVAEEIGLIEPLGTWVLEKACKDAKRIIEDGNPDFHIAVNLSPWQFRKNELPDIVNNIVKETGIPSANLNLEITESMAIDNVEESIKMMTRLTDIGLTLSIDDFGTGYSSLSYLSRFPVNILKIDKAFITGIPADVKKTGVVQAIISLSKNLGMKTVAEGVETEAHYKFLKERGCEQIQGYYFYKPMLFEELRNTVSSE